VKTTTRVLAALVLLAGCQGKPATTGGDSASAHPDTGVSSAPDPVPDHGQHIPVDSTKPTLPPTIIPEEATGATAGATVTVAGILNTASLTGKQVRVTGTCLGFRVPPVAAGSLPRTRSDWQLESAGQAIYVTGPLPSACDPTAGSTAPVTIVATVREDTLAAVGGQPVTPRRYLEWNGP
jgi:hypothetical protein